MKKYQMNIKIPNVVIEEVKMESLPANELSQFVPVTEAEPIASASHSSNIQTQNQNQISPEREEELIKRLIDGELSFSDYNMEIGQIFDVDELEECEVPDDTNEKHEQNIDSQDTEIDQSTVESTSEEATSSKALFRKELQNQQRATLRGNFQGKSGTKRVCALPPALQGLMGEANLCFARGQLELAEKLCLEIIRQVPLAHEPFLTLAQIHESNPEKHIQFLLVAAHLNPGDVEQWERIAQLSLEQGNVRQAINCYSKATQKDPSNFIWRLRRIELLQSIGEDKMAMKSYVQMLPLVPIEQAEFLMDTARMISSTMIKENQMQKAQDALNCAHTKVPQLFKLEDVNDFLDVLLINESYRQALDLLTCHTEFTYTINRSSDGIVGNVEKIHLPNDIPLDFRTKAIVSLVHLGAFHLIPELFQNIFDHISVEDDGDCYLDIAEALMKEDKYHEALQLLVPLVRSTNFSLAAVWLRYADCYRAIGSINEAIDAYKYVVTLAPQHFDARLTVSALLKQQGRYQEALAALEQNVENEVLDPCVLYERCHMLKETGNLEQYVDVGFLLLSRHCIRLRNRDEMTSATTILKYYSKQQAIKEYRRNKGLDDVLKEGPEFAVSEKEPTVEMEWELLKDMLQIVYDKEQFPQMQKILFTVSTAKVFAPYQKQLDFWAKLAAFYNRDSHFSYILCKDLVMRYSDNAKVWNFFNCAIQYTEDIRYSKFLLRLFRRTDLEDMTPSLIRANYFLSSGSYKYALNDYAYIYRQNVNPLIALLIAVTYTHLAQQKFMEKKPSLMAQAMTFAEKYREQREKEASHEVHYNLGRLYHQFGLNDLAVRHYKAVLNSKSSLIDENCEYADLTREAAFNLHLIYKCSGNIALAQKYLHEYIVI